MAPAAVPESLLKKRQRDEKWALEKTQKAAVAKKEAKEKRKVIFKKAEAYVKEYRSQVTVPLPARWIHHVVLVCYVRSALNSNSTQ